MDSPARSILVTGGAGRIGSALIQEVHERHRITALLHPDDAEDDLPTGCCSTVRADLQDLDAVTAALHGIDTVVHLAAVPDPAATWDALLPNNIVATYNTLVAAQATGCRRVVYASSVHAVSGAPRDRQIRVDDPVDPGDLYGVSKCFGEALCRYLARQRGLSCLAVRIGSFQPRQGAAADEQLNMAHSFVSMRDCCQLLRCCIEVTDLPFAILHAVSDNVFNQMDISTTRRLVGYRPQDSYGRENPHMPDLSRTVRNHSERDLDLPPGTRQEEERARGS